MSDPAGSPSATALVFATGAGHLWRATDWHNWRKRTYKPVAAAVGVDAARPYDLRHAFASLLINEGRLSVVEIAAQLGHHPTVCLNTYAHVMAEQRGAERVGAEEQIRLARLRAGATDEHRGIQLSLDDLHTAAADRAAMPDKQLDHPRSNRLREAIFESAYPRAYAARAALDQCAERAW